MTHKSSGPKFVSFSGIDGAGKSTQIKSLQSRLEASGLRVQLITFWDDVARLTNLRETTGHVLFKGDNGVGTPSAPVNRRDKNVRSWPMTLLRLGLYFVDAVSLRLVVNRALKSGADFIIFDRYAYDELANLTLRNPAIRVYVRLIMALVPLPHISYLLDADPVQACARKPEYPLDFLHLSRRSYLALSDLLGGMMTVIPPMPVQDVEQNVLKPASKLLMLEDILDKQQEMLVDGDACGLTARLEEREVHPAA